MRKFECKNNDLLGIQREKQVVHSRVLIMQPMNTVFQIFDNFMGFIPACEFNSNKLVFIISIK